VADCPYGVEDLFFGRVCPCGWERLVIRNVVVGRLRAAEDASQQAADVAALQEAWRESPLSGSPGCSREASGSTWVTAGGILRLPTTGKTPVLTVSTTKTRSITGCAARSWRRSARILPVYSSG
jgi:hypothetical protein